ncbi:hypothetical protein [Chlamydiifrater phoenicopteri]|uniref:hypothetical protein n=1 Tax=Chlamydiifrater phoenicopteri TaxID=2681469 RepID=UPI001BCE2715|nr:hypothetical protein [Chlamydiifrater phoenicopteri]
MGFCSATSFEFSPVFIQKTRGGGLEKTISLLDRALAVSSNCIRFVDVSETGAPMIEEQVIKISSIEVVAKVIIGILLLPLTILALALKVILRSVFYCKTPPKEEWISAIPPKEERIPEIPLAPSKPALEALEEEKKEEADIIGPFSEEERTLLKDRLKQVNFISDEESKLIENLYAKIRECMRRKDQVSSTKEKLSENERAKEEALQTLQKQKEKLQEAESAEQKDSYRIAFLEGQIEDSQKRVETIEQKIADLQTELREYESRAIPTREDLEKEFGVVILSDRDLTLKENLSFEWPKHECFRGKLFTICYPMAIPMASGDIMFRTSYDRGSSLFKERQVCYTNLALFWKGDKESREALLKEEHLLQLGPWYYQPYPLQLGEKILVVVESLLAKNLFDKYSSSKSY